MSSVRVGDVVLVFDGTIKNPKHKRLICCCADGIFLRINTKSIFRPCVLIEASDNLGCLEYDSYVELRGVIDHDMEELERAILDGGARVLGRIGTQTAALLVDQIRASFTLTQIEIRQLVESLASEFPLVEDDPSSNCV